ncbi:fatty acid hydroxylase [Dendrothele bispora CBS 962.96]|uniref:Fatty acid hydroxylase n=1 Tax=Dendrothele bispora (strain CBS 962.96) TaxID=1314807 RepID=A0A4S8LAK1_DENBC|nr:fatty acid hydroxylase [Dendrothele bispora CBS 962.96]
MTSETVPIPHPPRIPLIGSVTSFDREVPLNTFILLAKQYGEIYQLDLFGKIIVQLNSYALINEVCNEMRFKKTVAPALAEVRDLISDGLFTAHGDEENWGIAHRLLMPAFNAQSIRGMFDDMKDICDQLVLKWERFGHDNIIDPADDFTRLTLDTIALCSMSYRFNSFYLTEPPQFAKAMVEYLKECFARATRPSIVQAMMPGASAKFQENKEFMTSVGNKIIEERKANPIEKKDLLNIMLFGVDPKTGQRLSEDTIMRNLLTFLIAGHETSSGLLTFMTYYLMKNPETMRKLRNEIDEVVGQEPIQLEDLSKMPYLIAVMRETLRLSPPTPQRSAAPVADTVLGGKYFVKAGTYLRLHIWAMHKDPTIWGEDANEFRPERMLDGKFEALPPNAWQPFGFGARACIGRAFAWQEVQLVMASVVQKFDLFFVDPSYNLELQMNLTVKPKNFHIRARPRNLGPSLYASPSSNLLQAQNQNKTNVAATSAAASSTGGSKVPLYVLYGSNTGSSESFAQRISNNAVSHGFSAKLGTLDSSTGNLPADGPVVIITATYEGQPADNAAHFVDWLTSLPSSSLFTGVKFAVFGCGNADWVNTFYRIPTLIDQTLESHGGKRLLEMGRGDSGKGEFFEVFDKWENDLWEALTKAYSTSSDSIAVGFEITTVDPGTGRAVALRQADNAVLGTVKENRVLTKPGSTGVKRHLEFELPEGLTYKSGDYLCILPQNPIRDVRRVLAYFGLSNEQMIVLKSSGPTSIPTDKPVSIYEILLGYVELSQPATSHDLSILINASTTDSTRSALEDLKANYQEKILHSRRSVLSILETFPAKDINLDLGVFLRMLPAMRIRQYSISSSPLWNACNVTLTVSVLEAPSLADGTKTFLGVGSNYLSDLLPGDKVQMSVRASPSRSATSASGFHLPEDLMRPVIAFAAGSGLAPIRAFVQERAMQKLAGRDVGKILLFFGCRSPEEDYIYQEELGEWEKMGVVDVRAAFSRANEKSEGCKYVQDRLWHDRQDIKDVTAKNAIVFICGSSKVAKGVMAKCADITRSIYPELNEEEATKKLQEVLKGRYATDVFD